jgi:peptidoglycan/LPS O-acetylase OafA/YrhL
MHSHSKWAYQPALDGLRGIAVAMVVLFHAGASWMTGGYVGVSVFFTLSGYLITSLLTLEQDRTERVSLRAFYGRRLKRLMPASLICLVGVSLMAAAGLYPTATHLRRDVIAASLQVANWNAITQHVSYADLVQGGAGPLDHFWSLAVEEQFYWVWPLAFVAATAFGMSAARRWRSVGALALAALVAAPLLAVRFGSNFAYWATPSRLAEILTGAALAMALQRWSQRPGWLQWLGWLGLACIVFATVTFPTSSGPAYHGWLGVGSLASVAVIVGLQVPGLLGRVCSWRPLVLLGRVSYGVYVYHWPVFVLLSTHRVGWHGLALFALRISVTLGIAAVSFVVVEKPARQVRWRFRWVAAGAAVGTTAVILFALAVVSVLRNDFSADAQLQTKVAIVPSAAPLPPVIVNGADLPSRPIRILVLGDSTAQALSAGMITWAAAHPASAQVTSLAAPGCGLVRSATMAGDDGTMQGNCNDVFDLQLPLQLQDAAPDVVAVMITMPDISDRQWSPDEGLLSPLDQRYQDRKLADYQRLAEQLDDAGVSRVIWLTSPLPSPAWLGYLNGPIPPAVWATQGFEAANLDPELVVEAPFDVWLAQQEVADPAFWRPDGLHLGVDAAQRVMNDYLMPLLIEAARQP